MKLKNELVKELETYCSQEDITKIGYAVEVCIYYHNNQMRGGGAFYYEHPLEVAIILAEMHFDPTTIITALLHDTLEDTRLTYQTLVEMFGPTVGKLVSGVTKLSKNEHSSKQMEQADNFRKFFLSVADDIRALVVKLADRLHNMRTIDGIKSPQKRYRIARETLEIYAMLAERIGMDKIKVELQNLAFKTIHPNVYQSITNKKNKLTDNIHEFMQSVVNELHNILTRSGITAEVVGREKSNYSIWIKMLNKNMSFENLSDIIAFRIIVKEIPECYQALGAVHSHYKMVADTFQDFISSPKPNGYKSIHTTILWPSKCKIEIQIRTERMHYETEYGISAHWMYKEQQNLNVQMEGGYSWIKDAMNILLHSHSTQDFLHNTKLNIRYGQIFCFAANGDRVVTLPKEATVIDFAFAVAPEFGCYLIGAKVNGHVHAINYKIQNGDSIEIITSPYSKPTHDWKDMCVTGHARTLITNYLATNAKEDV